MINKIPSSHTIQKEAESCLKGITGIYAKFNPIPGKGYMIKIPLASTVMVENKCLTGFVDEVIFIFPQLDKPYLLILDDENRPQFFTFEGKLDKLLKKSGLKKLNKQVFF